MRHIQQGHKDWYKTAKGHQKAQLTALSAPRMSSENSLIMPQEAQSPIANQQSQSSRMLTPPDVPNHYSQGTGIQAMGSPFAPATFGRMPPGNGNMGNPLLPYRPMSVDQRGQDPDLLKLHFAANPYSQDTSQPSNLYPNLPNRVPDAASLSYGEIARATPPSTLTQTADGTPAIAYMATQTPRSSRSLGSGAQRPASAYVALNRPPSQAFEPYLCLGKSDIEPYLTERVASFITLHWASEIG